MSSKKKTISTNNTNESDNKLKSKSSTNSSGGSKSKVKKDELKIVKEADSQDIESITTNKKRKKIDNDINKDNDSSSSSITTKIIKKVKKENNNNDSKVEESEKQISKKRKNENDQSSTNKVAETTTKTKKNKKEIDNKQQEEEETKQKQPKNKKQKETSSTTEETSSKKKKEIKKDKVKEATTIIKSVIEEETTTKQQSSLLDRLLTNDIKDTNTTNENNNNNNHIAIIPELLIKTALPSNPFIESFSHPIKPLLFIPKNSTTSTFTKSITNNLSKYSSLYNSLSSSNNKLNISPSFQKEYTHYVNLMKSKYKWTLARTKHMKLLQIIGKKLEFIYKLDIQSTITSPFINTLNSFILDFKSNKNKTELMPSGDFLQLTLHKINSLFFYLGYLQELIIEAGNILSGGVLKQAHFVIYATMSISSLSVFHNSIQSFRSSLSTIYNLLNSNSTLFEAYKDKSKDKLCNSYIQTFGDLPKEIN